MRPLETVAVAQILCMPTPLLSYRNPASAGGYSKPASRNDQWATLFVSVTAQDASVPITVMFNWEAVMRH